MIDFPKVRNPLEGVTITRPPKCEPVIRGAGNPDDEAEASRIEAFEPVTENPRVTETQPYAPACGSKNAGSTHSSANRKM
jgi:hypothetical protein